MGRSWKKFLLTFFLSSCTPSYQEPPLLLPDLPVRQESDNNLSAFLLYNIREGKGSFAIRHYLDHSKQTGSHDFSLLYKVGQAFLQKGAQSPNPQDRLRAIYGAGISAASQNFSLLEEGLKCSDPQTQLVSVHFLSRIQDDRSDELLLQAFQSPFLLTRLEAAYHLAHRKKACQQISALMYKVDPDIRPLFPQLFAIIGSKESSDLLRSLLSHNDPDIVREAILSVREFRRDDLLPFIRTLSSHHDLAHQEVCALTLGSLKDRASLQRLQALAHSPAENVRTAALFALFQLGDPQAPLSLEEEAEAGNLFALTSLGSIPQSADRLHSLTQSSDPQIKANANLSLLQLQDPRCFPGLLDFFIQDPRGFGFAPQTSIGQGLLFWKVIPSAKENLKNNPFAHEVSLKFLEENLKRASYLPPDTFLDLANTIFESGQTFLIPTLVSLLEDLKHPKALLLLKKMQQKPGAPLIRDYCNLALYRLNEKGPYEENIRKWLLLHKDTELIHFRSFLPWKIRQTFSPYELTLEERSRLLVETYSALTAKREESSVEILLQALARSHPQNQYVLAGLLMHAIE